MIQGTTGIPGRTHDQEQLSSGLGSGRPDARLVSSMKKRALVLGGVAILVAAGIIAATRAGWWSDASAQAPRLNAPRAIAVEVATAVRKAVPVRIQVLGTVTPIASVAVKPRVD